LTDYLLKGNKESAGRYIREDNL